MWWETAFVPSIPVIELITRGTILYLAVFVMMRVVGRRESGEVSTADVILIVLISEAASVGIAGDANSIVDGVTLVATILLWSVALDAAGYRWPRVAALLKPPARPLIVNGELQHRTMRREMMSRDEVLSQLRLNGIQEIADVKRAFVEPNGSISVEPRNG